MEIFSSANLLRIFWDTSFLKLWNFSEGFFCQIPPVKWVFTGCIWKKNPPKKIFFGLTPIYFTIFTATIHIFLQYPHILTHFLHNLHIFKQMLLLCVFCKIYWICMWHDPSELNNCLPHNNQYTLKQLKQLKPLK